MSYTITTEIALRVSEVFRIQSIAIIVETVVFGTFASNVRLLLKRIPLTIDISQDFIWGCSDYRYGLHCGSADSVPIYIAHTRQPNESLRRKGLQRKANIFMLSLTTIMFSISACHWGLSVAFTIIAAQCQTQILLEPGAHYPSVMLRIAAVQAHLSIINVGFVL